MNPVLESIKPVIFNSKYIKINEGALNQFCSVFKPADVQYWMNSSPVDLSDLDDKARLNFIFVFDSINFCYWGDPKWTVDYRGKQYDGAWGMVASIKKAIDSGLPVLDAGYLSKLPEADLLKILKGNVEIPLFKERLKILREHGKILFRNYNGQFLEVINEGEQDAVKILNILTARFPYYNDCEVYNGQKIFFHKRAQLAIHDVHKTLGDKESSDLKNAGQLTAFADYKIPQFLRKLDILQYSPGLAKKVDSKTLLSAGSQEEIEIRANMIWAVELIKKCLKNKYPNITAADIDYHLWLLGQNKKGRTKPYHRTLTIWY